MCYWLFDLGAFPTSDGLWAVVDVMYVQDDEDAGEIGQSGK